MKMHEITVDDEVFEYLQQKAVPLVDTPNSVLRRLLFRRKRGRKGEPGRAAYMGLSGDASLHVESTISPIMGPYSSMRGDRVTPGGLSPRRMGRRLVSQEFSGEHFDRVPRELGGFRSMFESTKRLVYFLNFNKADSRNMLFRVTASAIDVLAKSAKPAYVIFSNPARRIAWVIPVQDIQNRHREVTRSDLEPQDLVLNIDIENNRLRELDWDISKYRREVENSEGGE